MVDRGTAMPPDALALSEGWNVIGKITELNVREVKKWENHLQL
jgi:hypothetical protein